MSSSFEDRARINISWTSSHPAITINLETFIASIYIELFATCVPVQPHITCPPQDHIVFFNTSVVHSVIREHVWICLWSEEGRPQSEQRAACLCTGSEQSEREGELSGESPPQCMLGRAGVMTEENLRLLRGQPAETAHWHQQRRPVTSDACHSRQHRDSQRGRGDIDVAPGRPVQILSLKVRADVEGNSGKRNHGMGEVWRLLLVLKGI